MNKQFITEVSRIHELMGVLTEQTSVLKSGSRGDEVKSLQNALLSLNYELPRFGADGNYGDETKNAVKQFQEDHKLTIDGIAGPKTIGALKSKVNNYGSVENTGSDSAEVRSAGYNLGVLFGEGIKKYTIKIGKAVFYVVVGSAVITYMIGEKIYTTTVEWGTKIFNFIKDLGVGIVEEVTDFAKNVVMGFKNGLIKLGIGIKNGVEAVMDGLRKLGNQVVSVASNVISMIKGLGKEIYAQALILGAKVFAAFGDLVNWMGKQWDYVKNAVGTAWEQAKNVAEKGVDWLENTAKEVYNQTTDFWDGLTSVLENYDRTKDLIMEMSIYSLLSEMEHNPNKNILLA